MKILDIKLSNFQGIASMEIVLDGRSASIFGDNGTGKTTIFNAITWLLFDKPSTGAKNWTPKTRGADGEKHNLEHSVTATFVLPDGSRVTLGKTLREVYKKKRGSTTAEYTGNTVDYFLDGVPVKEKEYMAGAIEELGWPLDRIIHAEVWATDTIPADLPPMVEFKVKADAIIRERWGIQVEHIRAKKTYEQQFYTTYKKGSRPGAIYGWPILRGPWCNSMLKVGILDKNKGDRISYIGIAADEPGRFHSLTDKKKSPLVEAGWTEAECFKWCEDRGLLSPIYEGRARGGCWFCHNQGIQQLRLLRRDYPEYWALMLKWDKDSIRYFDAHGHTVHDFERRFRLEDDGLISPDDKVFRWSMLEEPLNFRMF